MVGLEQQVRVFEALGQAEELLPQRPHRLIFASRYYTNQSPHSTRKSCGGSPTCSHNSRARVYSLSTSGAPSPWLP